MADNTTFTTTVATPPSGTVVAAREATAGGDTALIQLVTLAGVTGSEGAYTVREVFYADDAAFTPGTGGVLATGHLFDDVAPDSVDEGDIGISRMSANRNLYVQLRDNAGNERGLNVDASGNITVNVTGTVTVGSHAVTNAGTFAVQVDGSALTALQLIDDVVYADDGAWTGDTSKHVLAGGIYQSTPQTITDGRTAPFNMTVNGAMHVAVQGTVTVGSHAVTNAGTFVVQIDGTALTRLTDIKTNTDSGAVVGNGAAATAQRVTLANDSTGIVALTASTASIGKLAANSGVDIGDVDVTSIVPGTGATNLGKAEDGGHTSGDVGVFALGVRNDTPNAALAGTDLDYIALATYRTGAIRTAIPEEDFAALGSNHVKKYLASTGAVTDGIVWSPAADKRWYVTDLILTTSAAATVTIEDDVVAGDVVVLALDLAANSGVAHHFATPLFSQEDAADLLITTTAGNSKITVVGYEI